MQFGPLELKRCRYGWMLYSGPYIGKCFQLYGQYSESEVSMMRNFVGAGDTVIDVGANIGDLTIPMSQLVGTAGHVYAIESHPELFNVLCANLALNGIRNTRPLNVFVANSTTPDIAGGWGATAYLGEVWRPQFASLDSLELPGCALIKVDVDGKELDVLQSGGTLIERFRPVLYFENDIREVSSPLLTFVMKTLGYDAYWHPAPIFDEKNYYGNPVNHWAPKNIVSQMIVALPAERKVRITDLRKVESVDDWWVFD